MAGFVLLGLPETKGVPLENMETLFSVWLHDTPLREKLLLREASGVQERAARKHAGQENGDVEIGTGAERQ